MSADSSSGAKFEIGHVLFIDIVGYSKLLIDAQKERLRQLTEIVLSTSQVVESTNERLVRLPTGDGMALVFRDSSEEPVRCALEIAQAVGQVLPPAEGEGRQAGALALQLRMGIHSGPVSEVTDVSGRANIAGAGINLAQRVMDCGDAGHILLSRHVAEDLEHYPRWQPYLHQLGECEVKHGVRLGVVNLYDAEIGNAQVPKKLQAVRKRKRIRLLTAALLLLAALAFIFVIFMRKPTPSTLSAPEKSIAVLPFENLSRDPDNAYFADGIQDEILTRLSKIADLKVISRTSTQHYKSTPENLPEIAKQLGVAHVMEGSVQKSGDAVRVNVQLINAKNDSHLWTETYDRKLTDIFSVESEVAKAIADQLQVTLSGREKEVIAAKPTDNPEAYDAYLRGLAYTLKASAAAAANSLAAQKYFRGAVRLDPKFALSWALLSIVDAGGYITANLQPTVVLREEAGRAAETALTLQPNLGEAVLAKGYYHYACLKDYTTAVRYFEQARQLLPNSSRIPESLGYVARRRGEWDRSGSYFAEAERLDPRSVSLLTQSAVTYIARRRFPEALRELDQVLDIIPDDVDTLANKAAIAQAESDLPRAAALLAPLPLAADNRLTLRIKIYQAILERRTTELVPRLKEVWAKPDPAIGYINPEQHFWLGWAQEVAGDHAAAQETWREVRSEQESFLKEQPENYRLMGDLALTDMALGDKTGALSLAEKAVAANPIEKDAQAGPNLLEIFARVAAWTGDVDRAITALQKLLSIPYFSPLASPSPLTPALLRLDPTFDPLRNDLRFQKLCQEK